MISELNTLPADAPLQRFKCGLTTALAWLGARMVRYSFPVRLFHSLLHAGLSRRYPERAHWPTLTLSGIGQHAAGTLIPPLAVDQIGASLNLSIPIYEGGSTRAEIHQALALSEANRANVANLQDEITLDTQTAFHDLEDSVARFQATQQAVTSAKVSLEGTRKGYEIGSRSIIDLLTATTNYAAAQSSYYLALYTHLVARTQLKAAAGVLTPLDMQAINDLLYSSPSN